MALLLLAGLSLVPRSAEAAKVTAATACSGLTDHTSDDEAGDHGRVLSGPWTACGYSDNSTSGTAAGKATAPRIGLGPRLRQSVSALNLGVGGNLDLIFIDWRS